MSDGSRIEHEHAPARICTFRQLLQTPSLMVGDFHCPGVPPVTDVEAAPHPEIVFARKGAYVRRDEAGSVYIDRTVVAFFEAHRPYVIEHLRPRPDQTTVISLVDPGMVCESLGLSGRQGRCFERSALRATAQLHLQHRALLASLQRGSSADLATEECAVTLVAAAVGLNHGMQPDLAVRLPLRSAKSETDVVVAIAEFLNAHFRRRLSLGEIAAYTGYSVFHVCRMFQQRMKSSIQRYLTALRLEAAMELLLDTEAPITELALDLGFSSHSHFSAAFSRWTGMSPSKVRRQGRAEGDASRPA